MSARKSSARINFSFHSARASASRPRPTRTAIAERLAVSFTARVSPGRVGANLTKILPVEVLTPRSLDEALELKAERPDAVPIAGGTDVMVAINFDRLRPGTVLNLEEVDELRGWSRENGTVRLGARATYTELMAPDAAAALPALAEAARTVGSPQIRNRGTVGGNLGTAS